jgi:hypothetical protein
MHLNYSCPDLEKLVHPAEAGLGLAVLMNKRSPRFFLMYQKDWQVPVAESGIQVNFCPYCGGKLTKLFLEGKENSR